MTRCRRAGFEIARTIAWGFPFYSPMYRTAIEWVGGNAADIRYDRKDRLIASVLYHLYRLNASDRGDVLMVLGRVGPEMYACPRRTGFGSGVSCFPR